MAAAVASIEEQIREIEAEIAKTKYNKATQGHIGKLKAKVAKLRIEAEKRAAKSGGGGKSYAVAKSGDATVALVGLPSVGKSTLLNAITGKETSEVGAYQFTTLTVVPGAVEVKGANIQVLDLPGLIGGAAGGRGRGSEVISVVRTADLILLVLDVWQPDAIGLLLDELERAAIRVNQRPADIKIIKHSRGGINVQTTVELTHLDEKQIANILREFGVSNADVLLRDDATPDQLIDAVAGNRTYLRGIVALNKVDMIGADHVASIEKRLERDGWRVVPIAASSAQGVPDLLNVLFEELDFIRLYLKPQGKEADMEEPLVIRRGSTVENVCNTLHRDFARKFRYANVWGSSAKFPGQTVGLDHKLADEDILTIVVRR